MSPMQLTGLALFALVIVGLIVVSMLKHKGKKD